MNITALLDWYVSITAVILTISGLIWSRRGWHNFFIKIVIFFLGLLGIYCFAKMHG